MKDRGRSQFGNTGNFGRGGVLSDDWQGWLEDDDGGGRQSSSSTATGARLNVASLENGIIPEHSGQHGV